MIAPPVWLSRLAALVLAVFAAAVLAACNDLPTKPTGEQTPVFAVLTADVTGPVCVNTAVTVRWRVEGPAVNVHIEPLIGDVDLAGSRVVYPTAVGQNFWTFTARAATGPPQSSAVIVIGKLCP